VRADKTPEAIHDKDISCETDHMKKLPPARLCMINGPWGKSNGKGRR
jgi:hypothetical protein